MDLAEFRQPSRSKFQMDSGSLEIASFYKAGSHFVVGPTRIRLKLDGLVEVLYSLCILLLVSKSDSQSILCQIHVCLSRKNVLKRGHRPLRLPFREV